MFGKTEKEWSKLRTTIEAIFNARNRLIHGKALKLSEEEKSILSEAKSLLKRIIHYEVHYFVISQEK